MKNWREELNNSQLLAANKIEGPLLILAGAGSGKTKTMTHRICHMLEDGIPASSILAITFTNKAADEMKTRVEGMINNGIRKDNPVPLVCTFHSLGYRILKQFGNYCGYKGKISICDEDDRKKRIQDIIKDIGLVDDEVNDESDASKTAKLKTIYKEISDLVSKFKDELVFASEIDEYYPKYAELYPYFLHAKLVYKEYEKQLFEDNCVDLDDLIQKTVFLLEKNPEVLAYYNDTYKYISVDEYQDTSKAQARLVFLLAGEKKNVCVVGDDYQSIYAFRGAVVANILNFSDDYPGCYKIVLEENYRSTGNIVDGAAGVISYNKNQFHKCLRSMGEEGNLIQVREYESDRDESTAIATKIKKAHESGLKYSEMAILYRGNAMSRIYEDALLKNSIPYKIFGGVSFYDRKEVKDIVSYLKLASGSNDTMVLKRIANVPKRKLGEKTVSTMISAIRDQDGDKPLLDKLADYASSNSKFLELSQLLSGFRECIGVMSLTGLLNHIVEAIDYDTYLVGFCKDNETLKDKKENVQELISKAASFEATYQRNESTVARENLSTDITHEEILDAFLEEIALMSDKIKDASADAVSLMTMHKSKGLEFNTVFVTGCEEPSSFCDEFELEEERRLFYVSMTRAKKKLYITYSSSRYMFGENKVRDALRFIYEIPKENKKFKKIENRKPTSKNEFSFYSGESYYSLNKHNEKPWWL